MRKAKILPALLSSPGVCDREDEIIFQVPGAFQYLKMGSPISDLLNAGKPGRMGEYVGAKKKIAAIEGEGKNVPVLIVFFAHSFNDSLSV